MTEASRHAVDFTDHPDAAEIRARHDRVVAGPQAVAVDGLLLLAGLYLAVSPWVVTPFPVAEVGGALSRLTIVNLVVGLAVAVIGLALASAPARFHRLSWAVVVIGVWQLITPWVIGPDTSAVLWNNLWTGGVITALGLVAAGMLAAYATRNRRTAGATSS
ncbi:SPW repeat protein [Nocardia transvalensis]|uniref:SPW repeat protein n=1 Tax=Nocardia transvalensis TaxID=37333 RepID=UPI001895C76D|nr:SPW repeat protein [Nocardia transvalensis]MBF6330630.1 SPW repeat protein [Nocardia transvalensis]